MDGDETLNEAISMKGDSNLEKNFKFVGTNEQWIEGMNGDETLNESIAMKGDSNLEVNHKFIATGEDIHRGKKFSYDTPNPKDQHSDKYNPWKKGDEAYFHQEDWAIEGDAKHEGPEPPKKPKAKKEEAPLV